jgi:putative RNA 2'-phosphotransferase
MKPDTVQRSKFLSLILRHQPEKIGLTLDAAGWVEVDVLLAACGAHGVAMTRAELEALVAGSDKQRFALSADGLRIRANQGHSVPVELGYEPAEPPAVLYHGTVVRFLDGIQREGLKKGQRHHVHLSATPDTAVAVGSRRGEAIVLQVDAAAMRREGHLFYRTPNGVWLTEAVPPRYISCAPSR